MPNYAALFAALGLVNFLIIFLVAIVVWIFSLKVGIGAVKGRNATFKETFITALICFLIDLVIGFIPGIQGILASIISLIIMIIVIMKRHDTSFLGTIGALIIAVIILVIVVIVLMFVLVGGLTALFSI